MQKVGIGQDVTSDVSIYDDKGNSQGKVFRFVKHDGQFIYGTIKRDDGYILPVKQLATRIRKVQGSKKKAVKKRKKSSQKTTKTKTVARPFKKPRQKSKKSAAKKTAKAVAVPVATENPAKAVATAENLLLPKGFESFEDLAVVRKNVWIQSESAIRLMQEYLPDLTDTEWTVKRLYKAIAKRHKIRHNRNANAGSLGRTIDFFVNGGKDSVQQHVKPQRWSAKLDMARLLMAMFGTAEGKAAYLESRRLPDRKRLDDTKLRSVKVEYWIDIARRYNDKEFETSIAVPNDIVTMYLRGCMKADFRVVWNAAKLRQQFRHLRADYEGSREKRNFEKSGQNGTAFYPDFQSNNPSHVMLHYLMPKGVLGDLPESTVVDTNSGKNPTTVVNMVSSEEEENQETTPVVRRRSMSKNKRSRSPALSSASSTSTWSVVDATKSFQEACSKLMTSFESNVKKLQTAHQHTDVDEGEEALRLVETKKKLKKNIRELEEDSDADEDDVRLLYLHLQKVSTKIRTLLN